MKKLLAVGIVAVFMAIGFFSMAAAEEAEEFTITGYGPLQFAVVGDIKQQVRQMIESWGTKKPAKIVVHGFADKTGKTAENEMIARDRAREMKAFLETKTDAKVTALSEGDWEDARKVVVTVEFTVALPSASPPTAQPQASIFKVVLYLSVIALVILLLNILIDRRSRRKKAGEIKVEAKKELPKQPDQSTTKWVEVDGYSVKIEVDYVDGEKRFYSPFTSARGLPVYAPSEPGIISSLRRCLKPDSEFSGQVKSLQEAGLIRPSGCCS